MVSHSRFVGRRAASSPANGYSECQKSCLLLGPCCSQAQLIKSGRASTYYLNMSEFFPERFGNPAFFKKRVFRGIRKKICHLLYERSRSHRCLLRCWRPIRDEACRKIFLLLGLRDYGHRGIEPPSAPFKKNGEGRGPYDNKSFVSSRPGS
jgi:hypothetical protein